MLIGIDPKNFYLGCRCTRNLAQKLSTKISGKELYKNKLEEHAEQAKRTRKYFSIQHTSKYFHKSVVDPSSPLSAYTVAISCLLYTSRCV